MPEAPLCVYCRRRAVDPQYRPFCSKRCRMADLGSWLSGQYRVAGRGPGDPESPIPADEDDVDPERD